ncbi:LnmK family bifunctional acyltransferase/decarboxylase [Kitasatospora sp. LaBMicrA B282]|uniref:LnmK family bifunctional acyltransferase/decarboxylase n=1 Tax=Kitasatospora sp. LaBMicrA B282 TaxID=3420949 RepID=UPI003D112F28
MNVSTMVRQVTVTPAMSGFNAQLYAQIGDWTWHAVTRACTTDVLTARTAAGEPTYLAFYYIHLRGTGAMHPYRLSFGDRVDVVSCVFNAGGESAQTLHRLSPAGTVDPGGFDWREFYERPLPGCLYVENFNRWVARHGQSGNSGLQRSTPGDYTHGHLPVVPRQYHPSRACLVARDRGTFHPWDDSRYTVLLEAFTVRRPVDVARDFNAVGLMYFAAYISVVDTALWELWRALGRDSASFLARRIVDQRINYAGNAGPDDVLDVTLCLRRATDDPCREVLDATVQVGERLIAVATVMFRHDRAL